MMLSIDEQRNLLEFYYQSFAADVGLASGRDLSASTLADTPPLRIFDLTGQPLFFDFEIVGTDAAPIGVIRSSARGTELPLLDAILIGKQVFDPVTAKQQILSKATHDYPQATLGEPLFVCYGYPWIGLLVPVQTADKKLSVVYDANGGFLVKRWEGRFTPPKAGPPQEEPDGIPFYSYLSLLPEAGGETDIDRQWSREVELFEGAMRERNISALATIPLQQQPVISGTLLPVPLIGQETPAYCAVATAQMILEYLGYGGNTQTEIAKTMGTGPQGTFNAGMIAGYRQLTNGAWTAQLDEAPKFDKAVASLGRSIPAKTGIPRHARVLRGWREYRYMDRKTGQEQLKEQFYVVNDPYPVNSGQLVLENVAKPINDYYRNFLNVHPNSTPP